MASVKWSESSCWRVRAFSFKKYKLSDFPLSLFWTSIIRPHPFKQLVIYLNQAVSLSNWVLSVPVRLTQSGPAVTALSHRNVPMLSHGLPLYILSLSSHDLWTDIQDELPNKTCLKHKYSVAKRTFHKVHLSCHFTSGKHNYYVVCLLSEQLNQTLTVHTDWRLKLKWTTGWEPEYSYTATVCVRLSPLDRSSFVLASISIPVPVGSPQLPAFF